MLKSLLGSLANLSFFVALFTESPFFIFSSLILHIFSLKSKPDQNQSPDLANSGIPQNPETTTYGPPDEVVDEILKKMFPQFRTGRKSERKSGFSQSQLYTMQLYEGRREISPAAVKIAPTHVIEKEKEAYDKYIYQRLPHATMLHNSVYTRNKKWAGLHYDLVGAGVREGQSLTEYLHSDETQLAEVEKTLSVLLDYMGKLWKVSDTFQGFSLRYSYDRVLPVNLIVKPRSVPSSKTVTITPQTISSGQRIDLNVNSYVRLEGFEVTEVNPFQARSKLYEYILNHPGSPNELQPSSYRVRLVWEMPYPANYTVRKKTPVITGWIINTRANLLRGVAQAAFSNNLTPLNVDDPILPLPWSNKVIHLPNPLQGLEQVLERDIDVRVANIHGDLQVENIQVDPKTGDVSLIDFADARNDHVLHDLLRLETSLVTKWLSKVLQESNLPSSTIFPFYKQLHDVTFHPTPAQPNHLPAALEKPFLALRLIRQAAVDYLFKKKEYREYYDGLTIYLLGALKFKELEPFAHQVVFWGAATSLSLSSNKVFESKDFFAESIS